jgi:hypothetical protein
MKEKLALAAFDRINIRFLFIKTLCNPLFSMKKTRSKRIAHLNKVKIINDTIFFYSKINNENK